MEPDVYCTDLGEGAEDQWNVQLWNLMQDHYKSEHWHKQKWVIVIQMMIE